MKNNKSEITEFNLSGEIILGGYNTMTGEDFLQAKDVKEFIRLLKIRFTEDLSHDPREMMYSGGLINDEIDKLAGDKLI